MEGVTSVQTNVKWNGVRADFFKTQRSIGQGDPMSPYLFVLCMDKLSHIISEAVYDGDWILSHLMFADDFLLFGQTTDRQMQCIMNILNKFFLLSGQKVSIEKTSILFSNNVRTETRNRLSQIYAGTVYEKNKQVAQLEVLCKATGFGTCELCGNDYLGNLAEFQ